MVGKAPVQGDREAPPQVRGEPLPHHVGGVVVAVRAQRLPQQTSSPSALDALRMDDPASERAAVDAAAGQVSGMATAAGVDATEGRGGEGGEEQRVLSDRLGDGLPAGDPGPDEVEHVRGVQPGAGRALRGPAVPAPHMHHPQRVIGAGEARQHLTGGRVDPLRGAAETDGVDAVPDPGQGVGPGAEVLRHQSSDDQLRHLRSQVVELEDAVLSTLVIELPGAVLVGRGAGLER